jgi:hypothetical protein
MYPVVGRKQVLMLFCVYSSYLTAHPAALSSRAADKFFAELHRPAQHFFMGMPHTDSVK